MARKAIAIFSVVFISIMSILFFIESTSIDRELLSETFIVEAVYIEDEGHVEISFLDKSGKTKNVILEILGMPESFQKSFDGSEFTEFVPFSSTPTYGWKTNPVTLVAEHEDFGKVGVKTEIHSMDEPTPPIIFSKLD